MSTAYLVAGVRTPFGRYGGGLAPVRPDDLAAHVLRELSGRLPSVDWEELDDVLVGCANQAGEDNRNVARMATLLAGLPVSAPGLSTTAAQARSCSRESGTPTTATAATSGCS